MYSDITGYLSEEITNNILAFALLATLVIVVLACPTSLAMLSFVSGTASGVGQIMSNIANGEDWNKNVVGAIIGGTLTIALGGAGIFIGAAANAGINIFENKNIYNEDYSLKSIAFEFFGYAFSNAIARNILIKDPLYNFVTYSIIDFGFYGSMDYLKGNIFGYTYYNDRSQIYD